jgi:2-amino-4-hydroxy-6-hydroxymethyldihydropteridine diphosphokinase
MQHGYLALGSNLGDRWAQLEAGRLQLQQDGRLKLAAQSRIYQSTPVGFVSRRLFLNQVVEVFWYGPVIALLDLALEIQHAARAKLSRAAAAKPREHLPQSAEVGLGRQPGFPGNEVLAGWLQSQPQTMSELGEVNVLGDQASQLAAPASRVRQYFDRPLDIDLICLDGVRSDLPEMELPHPRAHRRAFVLLPLRELAPGLVLQGKPLDEWIATLPPEQLADCRPVAEQVGA